jgi:hypothetical protein
VREPDVARPVVEGRDAVGGVAAQVAAARRAALAQRRRTDDVGLDTSSPTPRFDTAYEARP